MIVPLVTLVTLVPVSIGGAGVREWLYVELFGSLGMRSEVALSLSLSVFAATLVWGFFGLALFAWGRRSQSGAVRHERTAQRRDPLLSSARLSRDRRSERAGTETRCSELIVVDDGGIATEVSKPGSKGSATTGWRITATRRTSAW